MNETQFIQRIIEFEDKDAIIWKNQRYSYKKLTDLINQWSSIFSENHIGAGDCIAVHAEYTPQVIALFLAAIKNKNILVPLSSHLSETDCNWYLQVSNATTLISFDSLDKWRLQHLRQTAKHPLIQKINENKEAGLILFSSGSTGVPKAMLLSFNKVFNTIPDKYKPYRTITFLLIDHIGGINTLMYTLAQGGTLILPQDRKPNIICKLIDSYQAELLPTTPTFLNMLLISQAYTHYNMSSLKIISYGAEPMPPATLSALHLFFPNVRLKQTYGMTEIGILPTVSENNSSVRLKVGGNGYETKISHGTLWVRGKSMMMGYLNVPNSQSNEGWIDTGDAVEVEGDYIRILGRQSEMINVGGEKVFPLEVENIILQADNIKAVTVKGKKNPVMGNVVIAMVELITPEDSIELAKRIRKFCQERLPDYKVPVLVSIASDKLHSDRYKKRRVHNEIKEGKTQ